MFFRGAGEKKVGSPSLSDSRSHSNYVDSWIIGHSWKCTLHQGPAPSRLLCVDLISSLCLRFFARVFVALISLIYCINKFDLFRRKYIGCFSAQTLNRMSN